MLQNDLGLATVFDRFQLRLKNTLNLQRTFRGNNFENIRSEFFL